MERLLTVKDIAARYGKSEKTASRYMRQMEHMEKPLRVTESALVAWEVSRTYEPLQTITEQKARAKGKRIQMQPVPTGGRFIIPKVRPKIGG